MTAPAEPKGDAAGGALRQYLRLSELPLTNLLFVLPLIVLYEAGTWYYASDPTHHVEHRIIAFTMMCRFFSIFGATGRFLPAAAIIAILIATHVVRKDKWQLEASTSAVMVVESVLWGAVLLLVALIMESRLPLSVGDLNWQGYAVLSLGAGVYEELVFRLIGFALLSLLLVDWMKGVRLRANLLIVLVTAILFSAYHYLGAEKFSWATFIFRTVAGIYFGAIFLLRGFGVTVGAHAAYDIIIVLMANAPNP